MTSVRVSKKCGVHHVLHSFLPHATLPHAPRQSWPHGFPTFILPRIELIHHINADRLTSNFNIFHPRFPGFPTPYLPHTCAPIKIELPEFVHLRAQGSKARSIDTLIYRLAGQLYVGRIEYVRCPLWSCNPYILRPVPHTYPLSCAGRDRDVSWGTARSCRPDQNYQHLQLIC